MNYATCVLMVWVMLLAYSDIQNSKQITTLRQAVTILEKRDGLVEVWKADAPDKKK